MPKKLSEAEHRELDYLRERCLLVLDFVSEHSDEPFPSGPVIRTIIGKTAEAGNLRGMRTIRGDLLAMSQALPTEDQRDLAELLRGQADRDPFSDGRTT
jgi:hypothetical protein